MVPYPLTDEQVEFFQANGYVQLHEVLTAAELDDLHASLDEACGMNLTRAFDRTGQNPDYDRLFLQKVNLWREHEGIRRFVTNPRLADIARRLSRSSAVRIWHDHALIKPGTDSKPTPWHQDLPYWPMREAGALSCWMALDDVDETNGCMQFIPGSHRLGRLDPIRLADPQDLFELIPEEQRPAFRATQPAVMRMRAGSCTFHDGLTFHSAFPNTSGRPRRAMVVIYMREGTTYLPKRHICTDGLGLQEGQRLDGELFPLVA